MKYKIAVGEKLKPHIPIQRLLLAAELSLHLSRV